MLRLLSPYFKRALLYTCCLGICGIYSAVDFSTNTLKRRLQSSLLILCATKYTIPYLKQFQLYFFKQFIGSCHLLIKRLLVDLVYWVTLEFNIYIFVRMHRQLSSYIVDDILACQFLHGTLNIFILFWRCFLKIFWISCIIWIQDFEKIKMITLKIHIAFNGKKDCINQSSQGHHKNAAHRMN